MRRVALFLAGISFAVALGVALPHMAHGLAANAANAELAPYDIPSPMAPKHPLKVALPGAAQACTSFAPGGVSLRLSCTVDCAYEVAIAYPDAGYSQAATADSNQLPAATPETLALPPGYGGICVYSATAGSAYVAARYP